MAKKFIIKGTSLEIYDTVLLKNDWVVPLRKIWYNESILQNGAIDLINVDVSGNENKTITPIMLSDSLDPSDVVFTEESFRIFAQTFFSKSRPIDVSIQDSTSPQIQAYFSNLLQETTLSEDAVINENTIEVTDGSGFALAQYISIFSVPDNRFYLGFVIGVNVNTLTVDSCIDFVYPSGSFVTGGSHNMAVDGSVTPQMFGLRNTTESIGKAYDITRLIFFGVMDTTPDMSQFGDIDGGLLKGVQLRHKDGEIRNILNVKSNGNMAGIMYDFKFITAKGAAKDSFLGRYTFSELGSVQRIGPGEDLQVIIQDNVDISFFGILAEGSEVVD